MMERARGYAENHRMMVGLLEGFDVFGVDEQEGDIETLVCERTKECGL